MEDIASSFPWNLFTPHSIHLLHLLFLLHSIFPFLCSQWNWGKDGKHYVVLTTTNLRHLATYTYCSFFWTINVLCLLMAATVSMMDSSVTSLLRWNNQQDVDKFLSKEVKPCWESPARACRRRWTCLCVRLQHCSGPGLFQRDLTERLDFLSFCYEGFYQSLLRGRELCRLGPSATW